MNKSRVVPYPKRLKILIQNYQQTRNPKDFHKILELVDRLLIRVIQTVYRCSPYDYLQCHEPNELYHAGVIALSKAILKINPDDAFSIKKLSSYVDGYVKREFKIQFSKETRYVGFESLGKEAEEVSYEESDEFLIEGVILQVRVTNPFFPEEGIAILRKHLLDGKSIKKISEETNLKRGLVRSWIHRGKTIIRRIIARERKLNLWQ